MNKFKKVMLGALSVLTLGLFAVVGTKVNAATTYSYGEATVTTTSYTGDTKTWDFSKNLPSSNVQIPVGDNLLGIVSSNDGTDGKDTQVIAIKSKASNGYDTYQGAEFLIPVPSATSSGTVSRTGNTTGGRYIALGSQTAKALASPLNLLLARMILKLILH